MKTYKKKYRLNKNSNKKYISFNLSQEEKFTIELYAQMLLDELSYQFNLKRLDDLINHSIDARDEQSFKELSRKYNELVKVNT